MGTVLIRESAFGDNDIISPLASLVSKSSQDQQEEHF